MTSLINCTAHQILFRGQIEKNRMDGTCSRYEESRSVYRVLSGKPVEKRSREGPRHR